MFLCENGIATESLWREYFDAAGDWSTLASIYVHVGSKSVAKLPSTSFFSGHEITERVSVVWGDDSIMRATVALIHAALKATCNTRFVLLSDTCAPLHSLRCTYAFLMRAQRSFVEHTPSNKLRKKYAPCLGFSDRQTWRTGANWVVLTRGLAIQTAAAFGDWRRACGASLPHLDEHLVQNLDVRTGLKLAIPGRAIALDAYNSTLTHFEFGAKKKVVTYQGKRHYAHWHAAVAELASLRAHPTLRAACSFGSGPAAMKGSRRYAGPDACANHSSAAPSLVGPCYLFVRKVPATQVASFRRFLRRSPGSRLPQIVL